MSAIDTTFRWCRNPTAINGLSTTYVSKRGSDVSGDGTAQNPYASIAKATAMATTNTNIMLDDGEWNEARTANSRAFKFWGNGNSLLGSLRKILYSEYVFIATDADEFNYLYVFQIITVGFQQIANTFKNCFVYNCTNNDSNKFFNLYNSIIFNDSSVKQYDGYRGGELITNSILINLTIYNQYQTFFSVKNTIFINCNIDRGFSEGSCCNNFTNKTIPSSSVKSINDTTTGQTFFDYFNYVPTNVLANPSTATIDDWLKCDFTAKAGSKNIGAGEKGTTIGLNQGYTMYADNSSNDMFKASNGAVLKNVEWNSTLNGYTIVQKEKLVVGATSNTITLDSSASSVDDYYNNLFVGIVGGDGFGELFKITDYNGVTKTATIDGTWTTIPTTSSVYTISGSIVSAVKDFGKVIKIKRNFSFFDNISALSNGEWSQFLTHTTTDDKQFPISSFSYEYSIDGTFWYRGTTADDLVSATNGENKVCEGVYGDCSADFYEENAKSITMRYLRVSVHIGFNIGE